MIKLEDYLTSIVIGIRYRANFSIADKFGSILDEILYSKKAYFNSDYFPLVLHSNADEKILYNKDTENRLIINSSNIIIENTVKGKTDLSEMEEHFKKEIVTGIMTKHKITQINRIGYIKRYIFPIENLAKSFIDKSIGSTIKGVNDINLRFSKKIPILDSLVQKDTYDYNNAIFNIIKRSDNNELAVMIDFQRHYEPFLESATSIEFDQFISSSNSFNEKDFLPWLNNNYLAIENKNEK